MENIAEQVEQKWVVDDVLSDEDEAILDRVYEKLDRERGPIDQGDEIIEDGE